MVNHGKPVDTKRLDSGYKSLIPDLSRFAADKVNPANIRIVLAVKDTITANPYGHSVYYAEKQFLSITGWIYMSLLLLGVGLLTFSILRRQDKREFDHKLSSWSGKLWLELKLFVSLLIIMIGTAMLFFNNPWPYPSNLFSLVFGSLVLSCTLLFMLWWFYLMVIDLKTNRKGFFQHNMINSILLQYRSYEDRYPWQKAMLRRAYALLAAEAVLALLSVLFLLAAVNGGREAFLLSLLLAGAGIYLIYRYLRRYNYTLTDMGKLLDHIELIKAGDVNTRLELSPDADMYQAAANLNSIQEGMSIAVAEKTRSERMKVELITNVSHDLKTPLTSIISYVDLLAREESLPEHVNDYIKILAQKSERLKNLIQDLFDLSKASSDNIALNLEKLDLARLIKQTFADMEEQIAASGLAFRMNIPEVPVFIESDGDKLRRVWENLISNALKYSLPGSRVFIALTTSNGEAVVTIKNTANYEMDFGPEDILQRFVRGDESRSTEGSGLGLSIAQSFTEICQGQFDVKIDGDLFKVELKFHRIQ